MLDGMTVKLYRHVPDEPQARTALHCGVARGRGRDKACLNPASALPPRLQLPGVVLVRASGSTPLPASLTTAMPAPPAPPASPALPPHHLQMLGFAYALQPEQMSYLLSEAVVGGLALEAIEEEGEVGRVLNSEDFQARCAGSLGWLQGVDLDSGLELGVSLQIYPAG